MNTASLRSFLEEQLLRARSGKPKLRLGVLAPDLEEHQLTPLWEELPGALFTPTLYLEDRDIHIAANVLTDEREFSLVEGLRSREELLTRLINDVDEGRLDLILIVQGSGHTLARELVTTGGFAAEEGTMVGLALHFPKQLGRPLLVGDLLVHAEPSAQQLADIVRTGAEALYKLGIKRSRVALLAAVETVSEGLPATVLGSEAAQRLADEKDIVAQGPLSFDLAVSEHAAEKKGVTGEVAGHADMLAAPNMTVARGVYEALCGLCEEAAAVVIAGGILPIAIPGSCDGREGVILSTFFASLL